MFEAIGIRKAFGGIAVLDGVDLQVAPGEAVGLVGQNGEGKSSLLEILSGRATADDGRILLDGKQMSPVELRRSELVFRSHQVARLFPFHTAQQNLMLGEWGAARNGATESGEFKAAEGLRTIQPAGTLSVGERRRLVLAWLWQRLPVCKFFLLDEPCAGGDASFISEFRHFVETATRRGRGVLWVEHNQAALRETTNRVLTLRNGRCTEDGIGRDGEGEYGVNDERGQVVPSGDSLSGTCLRVARDGFVVLNGANICVLPGEIVGVVGANGSGKSTLLRALYGDPACVLREGTVADGRAVLRSGSVADRLARGIHLMPQEGGVFASLTVEETIKNSLATSTNTEPMKARLERMFNLLPDVGSLWKRKGGVLSGGERRMAGMARIVALSPRFAMLDEPSAGLDRTAKTALISLIRRLAETGAGFLVVEQDVALLRSICHRIVSLSNGNGTVR